MSTERARHRFTVDDYERMVEAGILGQDDRVELIRGEIVEMSPIHPPHSSTVMRWTMVFAPRLVGRAIVSVQGPIRLGRYSMPQPDLVVLRPREDFYRSGHAAAADVLLAVEIADSSLRYDCTVKMPLYAAEGIAESWIVDVNGGAIEVYRSPGPDGYQHTSRLVPGDRIAPLAFPDLDLEVAQLVA